MSLGSRLRSLWRNVTQRERIERELDEELRSSLELLVDEKVEAGMSADQARRAAAVELRVEPVKERVRDVRAGVMMDTLLQDMRYAWRHVRRSPGFALAAVLTLALGIGANTAMFTMLNALLIQRLPIKDPDGLISMTSWNAVGAERSIPFAVVEELRRDGPFATVCGYNNTTMPVEANGAGTQAGVAFISGRCFETFGVSPSLGRAIADADASSSRAGNPVVLISHRFWLRAYGGDRAVLGKVLRTEGVDATIIGILPKGFGGLHIDTGIDIFAPPDTLIPTTADRRLVASHLLGRLRPGVTLEQARAELSARWPALLHATVPPTVSPLDRAESFGTRLRVEPIGTGISGIRARYAPAVTLIFGLTLLLLVLACVNLGGLLLTRLTARRTELAVRLALGGSPRRIAQQMLIEGLMLSLSGAALAVPLSFAFVALLVAAIPAASVPRSISFTPDARVLTMTMLVGVAVGAQMTALPTWVAMRRQASAQFSSDRTIVGTTGQWGRSLLAAQVALSVVLVVGAGLLARSLYRLQQVDLGVRTSGVLNVKLSSLPNVDRTIETIYHYPLQLERITALPGVRAAGFARGFPRAVGGFMTPVALVGDALGDTRTMLDMVSPGFFDTTGIPLRAGRVLAWSEQDRVGVVSESLARALAPDGNVLDRRVKVGTIAAYQNILIVGIVGNATMGHPRLNAPPVLYLPPATQVRNFSNMNLIIATDGDPGIVVPGVRQILQQGGREYAHEIVSLDDLFASAPSSERMSATVAGAVGGLAILLAFIGVHGTLASRLPGAREKSACASRSAQRPARSPEQ